ncbi:unnamed protein product [Phytomonas sp. EM1]|nr:unnamed protein product [Phytomonas sp. EM1]|eukprot:CCW64709.1 unnamed protein product [Phytomonas sp. isolate EM1]
MTLHLHSLASNTTGNAYCGGFPPPQGRGSLDKRALRQLWKIPTAWRVVEYLRQTFATWTLNGWLLRGWQRQHPSHGGGDAPPNLSSASEPPTTLRSRQEGMESNPTDLGYAPSRDSISATKRTPTKVFHERELSPLSVESHPSRVAVEDLTESGIHLVFKVLFIEAVYGLTHAFGDLVWVHSSFEFRPRPMVPPSKLPMEAGNASGTTPCGFFPANWKDSSSKEVERERVLDSRSWTLVIPDTVLRAFPLLTNHYVYVAKPFFVYPDLRCILCSYNITSEGLVAEHCAAYESAVEATRGSFPSKPRGSSKPTGEGGETVEGSFPVVNPTQGKGRVSSRLSVGVSPSRAGEKPPPSLAITPSKDLYDPLAYPIFGRGLQSSEKDPGDAAAWDPLGGGFPRGPGAEWEIPLEVLRALRSAHMNGAHSPPSFPQKGRGLHGAPRPSLEEGEVRWMLSYPSNSSLSSGGFQADL